MALYTAKICFVVKDFYFCSNIKPLLMKKVIVFLILAGFVSACSQYTCPTYGKNVTPVKQVPSRKV